MRNFCDIFGHKWKKTLAGGDDITWDCKCGAYIVASDPSGDAPPPSPFARQIWVPAPDSEPHCVDENGNNVSLVGVMI